MYHIANYITVCTVYRVVYNDRQRGKRVRSTWYQICLTGIFPLVATVCSQEWNAIAHNFLKDSRTGTQCATHWKMVLKPSLLKGVWSQEEDSVICDCVARGVTDWSEIASFLSKRKAKHCRERWTNHLDPSISKDEWSPAEEAQLLSAVEAHGTNWIHIARLLPGRSESVVQEHWNAIVFRNAASAGGVRRGRSRVVDASAVVVSGARGRTRASALPVEPERHPSVGKNSGGVQGGVAGGRAEQGVTLTERERALMDHAFKTGLTAAVVGGGPGGAVAPPSPVNLIGTTSKGGVGEPLTLSTEEDDIFAPLTAALLKSGGSGSASCSPSKMPPPSPTMSPLKLAKQLHPDYTAIGDQLGDGWGVDDDPALADLYRSLDNIGESLFNEDTFELSFDFDSVDKPSPSGGGGGGGGTNQSNPSKDWENLLTRQERENSPFRRAAAKAAATLEQRLSPAKQRLSPARQQLSPARQQLSPAKRTPQAQRVLEEACARAAAAAEAAQAAAAAAVASEATPSVAAQGAGPRVKQGFLRRLFSVDTKPGKQCRTPFNTVRGCLSEANAPPPPPPVSPPPARPTSPSSWRLGGENQAPRRGHRQPLSVALFTQSSRSNDAGEQSEYIVAPTLKHGKAEVKIPPPQAGLPLSAVPASRFN